MNSMSLSSDQPWKIPSIQPLDQTLEASLRARIERKAKPPGSPGRSRCATWDDAGIHPNHGQEVIVNVNWGRDAVLSVQQFKQFGLTPKMKMVIPYQIRHSRPGRARSRASNPCRFAVTSYSGSDGPEICVVIRNLQAMDRLPLTTLCVLQANRRDV